MKQTDFPELEGEEATNQNDTECVIAGCNYDVGITCVDRKDKTAELFCINGPSSPYYKLFCDSYPTYADKYSELFYKTVEFLKQGRVITDKEIYEIVTLPSGRSILPGSIKCAYKG